MRAVVGSLSPILHRGAVAGVVCAALVGSAAACGGSGASSGGDTVIKVWTSGSPAAKVEQSYLESWARTSKDHIKIDFTVLAAAKLKSQLPLAIRTGGGPDVTSPSNLGGLVKAGFLLPLDGKLTSATTAAYGKVTAQPSDDRFHGKLYAIPTSGVIVRLAYNKDLFRQAGLDPNSPPTTYAQLLADAKAITEKVKGAYGFGVPLKFNAYLNQDVEPSIIGASDNLTIRGLFNESTKKFEPSHYKPAIEMLRTMLSNKWAYPGATSLDADQELSAFAGGKIGMMFSASTDPRLLDGQLKTKIDWAASPLPVPDGSTLKQVLVRTGGGWAVSSKSKHQAAALKVLQQITGKDLQEKLAQAGLAYPLSAALDGQKFEPKNSPHYSQYQVDLSKPLQKEAPPSPVDLLTIQGDGWKETAVKLIENNASIDPALASLTTKLNSALASQVKSGKIDLSNYGPRS